jgi:hypothetical protein
MSDTPRTDAAILSWAEFTDEGYGPSKYVHVDDMRALERDLIKAKQAISEEKSRNAEREGEYCKINAELHREIQRRGVYAGALTEAAKALTDEFYNGSFTSSDRAFLIGALRDALAKNVIPTGTSGECPACFGPWSAHAEECPNRHITRNPEERPEIDTQSAALREQVDRLRLCAREVTPEADGVTYGLAGLCMEAARVIESLHEERLQRVSQPSACRMRFTGGETWVCDACDYRGDHDEKPDCVNRTYTQPK